MRGLALRARESFWFLPAVFGLVAIVIAEVLVTVDRTFASQIGTLPLLGQTSADGARSIATTIGTSMLTVAGTSFSITISVLATTSSTYGPRLVRNFMADRSNQFVLAMFTSTFLYALLVGRAVTTPAEDRTEFVPTLAIHVAVLLAIVDVAVLVYFIHHIASAVQITTLQSRVQADLVRALDLTRPEDPPEGWTTEARAPSGADHAVRAATDGYVQQLDVDELVRLACREGLLVDVIAMPGVHVARGDVLLRTDGQVTEHVASAARAAFVLGVARTPTQDVRYALQQLTEVSIRGLATGSNDPYTSVSALELASVALIPLLRRGPAPAGRVDEDGRLRVVLHEPSTEELLRSVFDSVRQYGLDHPVVVLAALGLADRLAPVASEPGPRTTLLRLVEELLAAYRAHGSDPVDVEAVERTGRGVVAELQRARAHR